MKSPSRCAVLLCSFAAALSLACADDAGAADSPPGDGEGGAGGGEGGVAAGTMERVASFGDNPGTLEMYAYIPEELPANAPLVVVLHGCTQSAMSMVPAGWNALADRHGFAVVYPQQTSSNNPVTCFNWAGEHGDPANLIRGKGENQSIASMVEYMIANHGLNRDRVYISGFSAGGAFAAVMLATWPDMFAAGAVQSGVPYRCAVSVDGAYDCQQLGSNPGRKKSPEEWGQLVRDAYPGYSGRLPRVSIWHGGADTFIVHHENLVELVEQWTDVHGVGQSPTVADTIAGAEYQAFESGGRVVVESYLVPNMGHATAMGAEDPEFPCALDGFAQYFEDRGICSTLRVADFFGLTGGANPDPGCGEDPDCNGPANDQGPPTVEIRDPKGGALVAGTVSITVDASDDVAVDRVELYVDGQLQETARSAPYEFSWPTLAFAEGPHDLMAMAYDTAGNVAVDELGVEIDNDGDGAQGPGFSGCAAGGAAGSGAAALLLLLLALALRIAPGFRR